MGILDQNLQLGGEILFNENGIIVYVPTLEQREQIVKILEENAKVSFQDKMELKANLDITVTRYLLSELTNLKPEIEELTDDELLFKLNNGNKAIKSMLRVIKNLLSEISEDIMYQSLDMIDNLDSLLRASTSMNKLEKTLSKLGLTMEDIKLLSQQGVNQQEILEKIKINKQSKSTKTIKSKKKTSSKKEKKVEEVKEGEVNA